MAGFKRTPKKTVNTEVEAFVKGAEENSLLSPAAETKSSSTAFQVKLDAQDHKLLKSIAEAEERSMQWVLKKLTAASIRKKAEELNIASTSP